MVTGQPAHLKIKSKPIRGAFEKKRKMYSKLDDESHVNKTSSHISSNARGLLYLFDLTGTGGGCYMGREEVVMWAGRGLL